MTKTELCQKLINMQLFPCEQLEPFLYFIQEILFKDAHNGHNICENWLILKDAIEAKNDKNLEYQKNKIYLLNIHKISDTIKQGE